MPRNSITRQRKLSVDAKGWAGCAGNFQKLISFISIFTDLLTEPTTTLKFLSRLVSKELVDLSRGKDSKDKIRKRRRPRQ